MIFLRFSTEFSPSTRTEKLPPVVVVTFNVIGAVLLDVPELELDLEPHPMAGTVAVCCGAGDEADDEDDDEGPPSRESPPPDLSIVLLGYLLDTLIL